MTTPSREDRIKNLSPEKRALLVKAMRAEAARRPAGGIPRREPGAASQLSFAQQRLWFLDQLEPGRAYYNVSFALRIARPLDVAVLRESLKEIVRRHEILRATFPAVGGQPVQVVAPELDPPLRVIDLRDRPAAGRAAEVQRLAGEQARQPFDLAAGPLLRLLLARTAEEEHTLLTTTHHIVFDGWSVGILKQELTTLLDAFSAGQPSPLPELPIQYADFSTWQRDWLRGQVLEEQLSYWKRQLKDAPPVIELPTDFPRAADQAVRSASHVLTLPAPLSDSLKRLSRQEDVTLFMTLLAAFKLLLHRYSGQPDLVIGSPIANRTRAEMEGLIGFFVNTLVLRTDFGGRPTFRELLQSVKATALGAFAHQDLPFEKLVEELQPERTLGHTPLFQVMFALQNQPRLSLASAGVSLTPLDCESTSAKFDLTLVVLDTPQGLRARMEYNAELFRAETVRRLLDNYQTLLESIPANLDERVHSLPVLSPNERRRLLTEWNAPAAAPAAAPCVHELFAEQAARTPGRTAVVSDGEQASYGELDRRSSQLAQYLRRLGVEPEETVALCCERSVDLVVGLLAALKAGAAYVPLDPAAPVERLSYMLAETRSKVLLTQRTLLESLPPHDLQAVCLDADRERVARESEAAPAGHARPENLAYMIFTSGSTGKPKAVAVEHRQLSNYVRGVTEKLALPSGGNYAVVSTFAADLGHTMLFPSLCGGGTLHVIARERAGDPESLGEYFRRHQIDCLKIVPSHLAALMSARRPASLLPAQRLVLGGEACRADWAAGLARLAPGCRIFNHYGPTETTVGALTCELDAGAPEFPTLPLGTPLPNVRVYVLDASLELAPAGVKGEICIGGAGVGRGYYNLPGATADKFMPDPFGGQPGVRLYRTGDVGRYLPDGRIHFLGRDDDQVKYHGYRVELGEIRHALKRHPQIRDAVARLLKDENGSEVLVAYYVSRQEIDVAEIRSSLKESLLEEVLPNAFVHLKRMPLTLNGKVNFEALPSWDAARSKTGAEYLPPRSLTEEVVADLWRRLLGLQRVGVRDNFFEVGGHSLLATRLVSQLRETFQVEIPLRALFETPTVEGLSNNIAGLWGGAEIAEEVVRVLRETAQLPGDDLNDVAATPN
ncbi:MAG TPA: amino acid adenylation domain-containing protein [Pyrinomonadaceae bacterium]|jgi:amino acid adenylation domain-containing protein